MRNDNNYIASEEELLTIPFEIPEGDSITSERPLFTLASKSCATSGIEGISSTSLVVGSSRGSIWLLSLEYNDTVVSTTPTVIRQPDEVSPAEGGHPVTQIKYGFLLVGDDSHYFYDLNLDFMQNAIYVVLSDKGIARCTLENPSCFFLANTDSSNIRKNIAVDSVNGHVASSCICAVSENMLFQIPILSQ
ncbi:unnamed protein product [Cylicostephanus goldi]|uniref:Uncharacterized protein n=1 Tax=Cylicostephanus goldi TaxID=71465 RepID=A0A3P6TGF7_CYLGO|nr:unnamed protein product [Cylicostephanus goldi]